MPTAAIPATRYTTCPRCEGDGEEVGAPVCLDGRWLCTLCDGNGEVTLALESAYLTEEAEEEASC